MSADRNTDSLITVGFTAYNAEDTVAKAIQSALDQTWHAVEILVVDDASTDNTPQILQKLSELHENISVLRNETNQGVASARNRLIENANGKFLAFFDDDDVSVSTRLGKQYDRICNYEKEFAAGQAVICHTARLQIFADGSEHLAETMGERLNVVAPNGPAVAKRILMGEPLVDGYGSCATCSQMARLETYKQLHGFDPQLRRSEDTDFNIRLSFAGGHFVGISEPMVQQTLTDSEDKNLDEERYYMLHLVNKHQDFLEKYNEYTFTREWIAGKYDWLEGNRPRFFARIIPLLCRFPLLFLRRVCMAFPAIRHNFALKKLHNKSAMI